MSDFLTLQEAADRLGVHYMTAYRYVRLGQLPAHKEDGTWRVAVSDLDLFVDASRSSGETSRRTAPWYQRFENRILEADPGGAWKVVEGALIAGATPLEVYQTIFVPTLRSIGDRWERGEIDVAGEHHATATINRFIGRMSPSFIRRGRRKGTVLVVGPPGERHTLGLAMVGDALRGGSYSVLDLGSDLPTEAFEAALQRHFEVAAVCIGVLNSEAVEAVEAMVEAIRHRLPSTVPVIVGGGAIADNDHAFRLGADRWADLETVVAAVEAGRRTVPAVSV